MLSPTDTSSSLKESTDNQAASYSEVGAHWYPTSQNLQSEEVLEEKQTSLEDSSKIAIQPIVLHHKLSSRGRWS